MLDQLTIRNFKCFNHRVIPLSAMSLLTGHNASGKSTVIQALLLASQIQEDSSTSYVPLNGGRVRLGAIKDVLDRKSASPKKEISFEYRSGDSCFNLALDASHTHVAVTKQVNGEWHWVNSREHNKYTLQVKKKESIRNKSIEEILNRSIFISPLRNIEMDIFPSPTDPDHTHADVGKYGQYASWFFDAYSGDEILEKEKMHQGEPSSNFRKQLDMWMGELFPMVTANVIRNETLPSVKLQFRKNLEEWDRPINIGYGLSYAFPIIVAGLLAKKNQMLIVDSPEAHLHPRGQSAIGFFLAKVSSSGTQVIIETHSDHVLNGVRRAVANQQLQPTNVSINYFNTKKLDNGSEQLVHVSPQIDKTGALSEWPEGFFDQADKDLSAINDWR